MRIVIDEGAGLIEACPVLGRESAPRHAGHRDKWVTPEGGVPPGARLAVSLLAFPTLEEDAADR
jgi:hypothetical protein